MISSWTPPPFLTRIRVAFKLTERHLRQDAPDDCDVIAKFRLWHPMVVEGQWGWVGWGGSFPRPQDLASASANKAGWHVKGFMETQGNLGKH